MFFHNFSPDCVYVVMILASATQSSIRVMNKYGELCWWQSHWNR